MSAGESLGIDKAKKLLYKEVLKMQKASLLDFYDGGHPCSVHGNDQVMLPPSMQ